MAGTSITVFSIRRNANNNFVDNVAATAWSLPTTSGGVVAGDLIVAGDSKSATFTGHGVGTATIRATSALLPATDSGLITVVPGAASKLQLLVPGETAAPGTLTGKTGTPNAQAAGTAFNVTVNAVDAFWNRVATVNDTVAISSSDGTATLPADAPLVAGTATRSVMLNTAGSWTVTATDVTDGTKTLNTSPPIAVSGTLTITARETQDTDGDGYIDAIRLVCSQPVNDNFTGLSVSVAGYTVSGYDTGGPGNDNEFFVRLNKGAAPDTGETPKVRVLAAGSFGRFGSSERLPPDAAPVTPVDRAQPVLMEAYWDDKSEGGVSVDDDLRLTFSEPVTTAGVVITNSETTSDIWLPVLGDTLSTSTLPDGGLSTQHTINLDGDPLFTPGGTYKVTSPGAGSPSGIYISNGAHIKDAAGNPAFVQGIGTAVDIPPGDETICIAWDETGLPIGPKTWDIGTTDLGVTCRAFASFPPDGLVARNAGDVRVKFTMSCSVAAPSGWTLATTAGTDQFEMKADITVPPYGTYTTDLATGPKNIATALYSGHSKPFDLQFVTPTALTVGAGVQQTITVTITATKD
ncbi:MAG: hypothetical protein NTW87_10210 [Planctomycetota bacterium]|nr:hypothetical protein [Planctomycetota bacterium]